MKIASSEHLDNQLAGNVQSPSAKLESREQHDSVAAQIRRLSSNQQEVLRLKFNGGLSYKEIAEALSLTVSAVKSRLHRARHALAQAWNESEELHSPLTERTCHESPAF